MAKLPIFKDLLEGGYISLTNNHKLTSRCRDKNISVFKSQDTGVIYLDCSYNGPEEGYYADKSSQSPSQPRSNMDIFDTRRRHRYLESLIAGKRWLDYGSGPGFQIKESKNLASKELGFDLNKQFIKLLQEAGYNATHQYQDIYNFEPQVISLFHVLEHLPDPTTTLIKLAQASAPNALLIIEIPHAKDWLISNGPKSFRDFTFWSEHLVLHTRESLSYILEKSGWRTKSISGVQRYSVGNHLHWFAKNSPSGMGSDLYSDSAHKLHEAYQNFLSERNETDTLIAIAEKPDE